MVICDTSNMPASRRTWWCSSPRDPQCSGMSQPPKSTILAPALTCVSYKGVRLPMISLTWRLLLFRVIRGAHQCARLHPLEPHGAHRRRVLVELRRRHVFLHRQMIAARAQILAQRHPLHAGRAEIAQHRQHVGELRRLRQQLQRTLIIRTLAHGLVETRYGLDVVAPHQARAGVQRVSLGQYLRTRRYHLAVQEYVTPAQFDEYAAAVRAMGVKWVKAGALVRSSYHAEEEQ